MYISTCETCCKVTTEQPKETLMSHAMPNPSWQKVGIDLFEFDSVKYFITNDYFTNFWEIDGLEDIITSTAIYKLKAHLVRYGILCQLISDTGPSLHPCHLRTFRNNEILNISW